MDAKESRQLSISRSTGVFEKLLDDVLLSIRNAAEAGQFSVEHKFPTGTSMNHVRRIQTSLVSKGYTVQTTLFDNVLDSDPSNDIILAVLGAFNLSNMNYYASFDYCKMLISW